MPGERIVLAGDRAGRIRAFVAALERFPTEPLWVVVGGFAVNVRLTHVHRLTNDLDTISRSQTELVDILADTHGAERLAAAKLRVDRHGTPINIDVMADTSDTALPTEPSERAFALARRVALATARQPELVVMEDAQPVAEATAPVATTASLIALKTVAIPRRASSASPAKVGSDIHDLVRLVEHSDIDATADEIAAHSEALRDWVGNTLVKWFSPEHDLRYTHARLRRLDKSPDAQLLTEDDYAPVAQLGYAILNAQLTATVETAEAGDAADPKSATGPEVWL